MESVILLIDKFIKIVPEFKVLFNESEGGDQEGRLENLLNIRRLRESQV